ncbi:helix-turn-helix domain-containing protein [Streptomyces sp. NPDC029216]|uniref:helix-turn-helix domain-containing protein n=1 Tax=Streptomyces sp. NPDC029216 TaxID=3154701 RepID=UPI0033C8C311
MGRRELPVDCTVPAFGALATALRELRAEAGLTYDELAVKTGLSPTALKRALAGRTLPSRESVTAISEACGGSDGVVELWRQARIAGRGRLPKLRPPAAPELITARGDLSEALQFFYEKAGAPSLRRLQALAGGAHLLPVSSAARIINRQALPASRQQCVAFLTACEVGPRLLRRWADAFTRITSRRARMSADLEDALAITWSDLEDGGSGWRAVNSFSRWADPAVRAARAVRGSRRLVGELFDQRRSGFAQTQVSLWPGPEQEMLFRLSDDSGLAA